jgi:hypothetical protein
MAAIDRVYCPNYEAYVALLEWAKNRTVTFFDGHSEDLIQIFWNKSEENFAHGEVSICSAPYWAEVYMIRYCPFDWVQARLKEQYNEKYYTILHTVDPFNLPEGHIKGRKIVVDPKAYNHPKTSYWLLKSFNCEYNEKTNRYLGEDVIYPNDSWPQFTSKKAIIRFLRQQLLPANAEFFMDDCYNEFKITLV